VDGRRDLPDAADAAAGALAGDPRRRRARPRRPALHRARRHREDRRRCPVSPVTTRLLEHMRRQLESSRRLLEIVLLQSSAIRKQDVETVLSSLADVQAELAYRARIELEREQILVSVAAVQGIAPDAVDLETILRGVPV